MLDHPTVFSSLFVSSGSPMSAGGQQTQTNGCNSIKEFNTLDKIAQTHKHTDLQRIDMCANTEPPKPLPISMAATSRLELKATTKIIPMSTSGAERGAGKGGGGSDSRSLHFGVDESILRKTTDNMLHAGSIVCVRVCVVVSSILAFRLFNIYGPISRSWSRRQKQDEGQVPPRSFFVFSNQHSNLLSLEKEVSCFMLLSYDTTVGFSN